MFYKKMDLQLFEDGTGAAPGNQGGNAGGNNSGAQGSTGAAYSFEQAEEIANARAQRAEQAALRSYFQQQGMRRSGDANQGRTVKRKNRSIWSEMERNQ